MNFYKSPLKRESTQNTTTDSLGQIKKTVTGVRVTSSKQEIQKGTLIRAHWLLNESRESVDA